MRKSYSAEILLLISSAMCGMLVGIGNWWLILIGSFFICLVSWFITPILKIATIKEYIESTQKTSKKSEVKK